jgi:hypothetical protein
MNKIRLWPTSAVTAVAERDRGPNLRHLQRRISPIKADIPAGQPSAEPLVEAQVYLQPGAPKRTAPPHGAC